MNHIGKNKLWLLMMFAVLYIGSACQLDDNTQAPHSDDDASLRGHILDAHTAAPLVGVQVSVGNDIVGFRHAMTDDTGWFLIEGCDADATTLIVDGRDIDSGHYSRITLILPHGQIVSHKKHTMPRPIYLPRVNKTQATLDLSNRLIPSEDPNHPAQDGWWQVNTRQPLVLTHEDFTIYRGTEPTRLRASASLTLAPESFIKFPHGDEPILSMTSVSPLRLPWSLPRHVAPDIMLALEPYGTEIYPPATLSFWDKNTTAPSPDDQHYSLFALTPKTNQLELKASFLPQTQMLERNTEQVLGATTTAVSTPLSTGQQVPLLGFVSGPVCAPGNTDLKSYRIGISRYYHWDTTESENNNQPVVFDRTVPDDVPTEGNEDYPHADIRSYDGLLQEREYSRENTADYAAFFGILVQPYLTDHTASFPETDSPINDIVWGEPDNPCYGTFDLDQNRNDTGLQIDVSDLKVCIILPSTDLYACAFDYTYYYRIGSSAVDGVTVFGNPSALTSLIERSPSVTSNPDPVPHNKNFDAPPGGGVGQSWWRTSGYYDSEPYLLTLDSDQETLIYPNIQRYDWTEQYDSYSPDITSASYRREREEYRNSSYGKYGLCDDCCPTTYRISSVDRAYENFFGAPRTIGEIRFTNQPRNGLANRIPNVVTRERTGESVGLTGDQCAATCDNGRTSTSDPWSLPDRNDPDVSLECPDCLSGHITQMGTTFYMDFREWDTYREDGDDIVQSQGVSRQCLPIGSTDPETATELATEACTNGATWSGNLTSIEDIERFNTEIVVDVDGTNRHYTKLSGNINIQRNSSITAISLIRLCEISRSLNLQGNTSLESVALPALTSVGDSVLFSGMHALTSISLPSLTSVGGQLVMQYMGIVKSVSLPQLTHVDEGFYVLSLSALTSLPLPALTSVGGDLTISYLFDLESLSLPTLTSVGGDLTLSNLDLITSLPLSPLTSVGGDLNISSLDNLTSLPLSALTSVGGNLLLPNLPALTSLPLSALTSVGGSLSLPNLPALTSLPLSALISVGGSLLLPDLPLLTSLPLSSLTSVGGNLTFGHLDLIIALPLSSLTSVGGDMNLSNLDNLTSLPLSALTSVEGYLNLSNLDNLTALPLSALTSVGGSLLLPDLPALTSLPLSELTSVGGNLIFSELYALTSLPLASLTSVGGNLTFSELYALTSLPLSELTSVGGNLTFSELDDNITSLQLSSLTSVGGNLIFSELHALTSLPLSSLTSVGGSLLLPDLPALTSLPLSALTSVGGDLTFYVLNKLTSLPLSSLTSVGGNLTFGNLDFIRSLPLSSLTSVGGNLTFHVLNGLRSPPLSSLTSVGGDLIFYYLPNVTSLPLSALTSIEGGLFVGKVGDQNALINLKSISLSALTSVGGDLRISSLFDLTSMELPALTSVGGDLTFHVLNKLSSLPLPALTSVGGDLTFDYLYKLRSLPPLPVLTSVGGGLRITDLLKITSMSLPALTSVGGGLRFHSLPRLTSMSFPALTSAGDNLSIYDLDDLESISLSALTSVGGYLWISYHDLITSLSLPALTSIGEYLKIESMPSLNNLSLPILTEMNGLLIISENQDLCQSIVDDIIDNLTEPPTAIAILNNKDC